MNYVRRVPCHHNMARPKIADGEGLQIWRVAANILNKKSRTADKEWSSCLGGVGLTAPHRKKVGCYEMFQSWTWTDSLAPAGSG
jgi:hypothetical protein